MKGFQGDKKFKNKERVLATLKHFAGHGEPERGMNCAPANVSERVLREIFLQPFKDAIDEAGVVGVMPPSIETAGVRRPPGRGSWGAGLGEKGGFERLGASGDSPTRDRTHRLTPPASRVAAERKA